MEDVLNLGPKSSAILAAIGVSTLEQLEELGVEETFRRAKLTHPSVTLNLLWGLEGALAGTHWREVSAERKAELKRAVADVLGSTR